MMCDTIDCPRFNSALFEVSFSDGDARHVACVKHPIFQNPALLTKRLSLTLYRLSHGR